MTNEQVKNVFNDVYVWWQKYREISITPKSKEWKSIIGDADEIMRKYEAEPLAVHMINELVRILEHRAKEESTYVVSNMRL